MMNLVLLLVFHLVALSWQASSEPVGGPQPVFTQQDAVLWIRLDARGAIRVGDREVEGAELSSILARRTQAGRSVRVEVDGPAGLADARLAEVLRKLREAGAEEILFAPSGTNR
jgi:biopolymer transport protein ExbD